MYTLDFVFDLIEENEIEFDTLERLDYWDNFLSSQIISQRYDGFKYFSNNGIGTDLVISPKGTKMTYSKIYKRLRNLEFQNPHQIEAKKAWEFYQLNRALEHFGY